MLDCLDKVDVGEKHPRGKLVDRLNDRDAVFPVKFHERLARFAIRCTGW